MATGKTRIGIMGFGEVGRQVYHLAAESEDVEVVAISDLGSPGILHYLLGTASVQSPGVAVEGNYLVNPRFRSRVLQTDRPAETPWDLLGVDLVIEGTGKFSSREQMAGHLANGAGRVLLSTLPDDHIDRLVIPGLNTDAAQAGDRMISAGSATTAALALALKILDDLCPLVAASMTSVHAYTSDQPVQDYAGADYRRSRSAAENIIPNGHPSIPWIETLLPGLAGKVSAHALNVPVQKGSLLDLNLVFQDADVGAEAVNEAMVEATSRYPGIVDVIADPVVSSDVIGNRHSLLFDLKGTLKGGARMVKALGWYETLGHACRLLDVVRLYAALDAQGGA
jgi:glyceraldehyde 3-phosphate dehydrogenase